MNIQLILKSFILFGLLFYLQGCSAKGKLFTSFNKKTKNKGTVYFYRLSNMIGYAVTYPIYNKATGKVLGKLPNAGYFSIELDERVYIFSNFTNSIEVEVSKNNIICIHVYPILNNQFNIVMDKVSRERCLQEIAKTRKSE